MKVKVIEIMEETSSTLGRCGYAAHAMDESGKLYYKWHGCAWNEFPPGYTHDFWEQRKAESGGKVYTGRFEIEVKQHFLPNR